MDVKENLVVDWTFKISIENGIINRKSCPNCWRVPDNNNNNNDAFYLYNAFTHAQTLYSMAESQGKIIKTTIKEEQRTFAKIKHKIKHQKQV